MIWINVLAAIAPWAAMAVVTFISMKKTKKTPPSQKLENPSPPNDNALNVLETMIRTEATRRSTPGPSKILNKYEICMMDGDIVSLKAQSFHMEDQSWIIFHSLGERTACFRQSDIKSIQPLGSSSKTSQSINRRINVHSN